MSALTYFGPSTGLADAILGQRAPLLFDRSLRVKTPALQRALATWHAKRGDRKMPARADFGMRDLAGMLPQTCILQIVPKENGCRFFVRLMGTALDQTLAPITGRFVDEAVPPQFAARWEMMFMSAVDAVAPVRISSRVAYRDQLYLIGEGLIMPLSDDGETSSGVMVIIFHYGSDSQDPERMNLYASLASELETTIGTEADVTSKA